MRILITGTGAGVGKTWVGQALALAFRSAGKRVVALKPVETGCLGPPGDREDGVLLARATGQSQPRMVRTPPAESLLRARPFGNHPARFDARCTPAERA
jgi:dethiobiotin synthetase